MRNRTIWITGLTIALIAGIVLVATAARATEVVAIDTVHKGESGDLFHEGTIEAVGACTATLRYTNSPAERPSDHPNTDILVGPVTFTNVERGAFVDAALTFIGTGTTDIWTRLGGDGVSSGGFTLEVTCNPPKSTTTTQPNTTPTTDASTPPTVTTPPVTTTTLSPPPVGGISTGGGACADGSCSSLSPLETWLTMIAVFLLAFGAAWAFVRAWTGPGDDG